MRIILLSLLVLLAVPGSAQNLIRGKVTADKDGAELIGVTIRESNTNNGTISDANGDFQIQVGDANATLEFAYTGFETLKIALAGQTSLEVKLIESASAIDEVVVVGYGTQKKSVVTGAISKIKSSDLENQPVVRLEQSLQGRASGVRVTTNSGQPGAGAVVRVRGTTSINSSDPLYVVDGVVVNGGIDYLNQSDIESIEVLKDAASASIYGARSANGVILVTTKKGKENAMEVTYNMYIGQQAPWRKLSLLNAREYATLMNEASVASGGNILFADPAALGEGTDWQDAVFREDAPIQNHELGLTAGNERSKYYASFGYFDQSGIVSQDKSEFKRFTARLNSSHRINKRITVGNAIGYTRVSSIGVSENTEYGSPLNRAINLDPITPIYETDPDVLSSSVFTNFPVVRDQNGYFGISQYVTSEILNPLAALYVQHGRGWSDKVVGNFFGEWEIIDGLKYRTNIGVDLAFWGSDTYVPVYYLNAANTVDVNSYSKNKNNGLYYILENTLSYDRSFGPHRLNVLAGITADRNKGEGIGGTLRDIPVDSYEEASLAFPTPANTQGFYGYEYEGRTLSYLGRLNYNYDEKYLFSGTIRRDGSSKFGSNNKFGNFPSVSVGWVVTRENFLLDNSVLNFMKIRASWGVNGSDRIGDFRYVSTVGGARNYTFGLDNQLVNGVSPNAIANPDLRWEETVQSNIGIDATIFNNIRLVLDVFNKKTTDMLLDIAVPGYVGNSGPVGNIATMENRGIELEAGYSRQFGGIDIGFNGNVSYIENEVTFLGDDKEFLPGQTFSPQALELTRTAVGMPIGFLFGYKTDGIFQNQAEINSYTNGTGELIQPNAAPGDFRFVDVDGDGVITADDRTMIGDPTPTWTYGLTLTAAWKGFDLLLFGQGVGGNDIFKATRRFDLQMANLTSDALGRWTGEGSTNSYPRLSMTDPNQNFSRSSDFYVENGAFFRIKTLQIGYSIPQSVLRHVNMKRLRFYISGNNLFTFTQYTGFDPEIGAGTGVDRGIYPQPRFFLVGANVNF